ncbi:MAG: hypothetical protein M3Q49_13620 [Actinomycetota bacterium]|nr:hypothetical protein [Actinomycetota bacterium]
MSEEELRGTEETEYQVGMAGGHTAEVFTRRGRQNRAYALRAARKLEAFVEESPSEHYVYADNCVTPTTARGWMLCEGCPRIPQRVLTELGRIEDDSLFWEAADWYAEHGLESFSAAEAAKVIRRNRLARR